MPIVPASAAGKLPRRRNLVKFEGSLSAAVAPVNRKAGIAGKLDAFAPG